MPAQRIPRPTPFVPDAETFLKLIGRKLSSHSAKIPSWEALFSLSSQQLREAGVEPARSRRYLLHWRDKFRRGEFGIGGDLTEVTDGVGELRIIEVPVTGTGAAVKRATLTSSPGMRKIVVNVPAGQDKPSAPLDKVKPVSMVKIVRASVIAGSKVEALKGVSGGAKIVAKEGLWEQRRGHKVDGGERRKAEVRAKRRSEERKTTRA
ncbi:telomere length regulation protein [Taxawa tesnikishii (nom. ined.)]|nr:telomere length regulation protein [Dothideales sp. JES 119]